jgi:hypothetical protein
MSGEILTIISPAVDRATVCSILEIASPGKDWTEISWKDGRAKMSLEAITASQHARAFKEAIGELQEHFSHVATGADLKEINRRLKAAAWLLRITASPGFASTREDSQTISRIAIELDGTCITADAVIDPFSGEAILTWD